MGAEAGREYRRVIEQGHLAPGLRSRSALFADLRAFRAEVIAFASRRATSGRMV
jgi:hypothetical protein